MEVQDPNILEVAVQRRHTDVVATAVAALWYSKRESLTRKYHFTRPSWNLHTSWWRRAGLNIIQVLIETPKWTIPSETKTVRLCRVWQQKTQKKERKKEEGGCCNCTFQLTKGLEVYLSPLYVAWIFNPGYLFRIPHPSPILYLKTLPFGERLWVY